MIKVDIDGLYIRSNLGGTTRGLNHLKFVTLVQGTVGISVELELWISS